MAKDPEQRFQTPAEVVKAIAPFAGPTPVVAAEPAPAKKAVPLPVPPVPEPPRSDPGAFLARCPFCRARMRIPARALGASLPCPQCSSFFTAVPEDAAP
jgi:hypothetical protein